MVEGGELRRGNAPLAATEELRVVSINGQTKSGTIRPPAKTLHELIVWTLVSQQKTFAAKLRRRLEFDIVFQEAGAALARRSTRRVALPIRSRRK